MTNFLTRLLERTQGMISSTQLAQPLLTSTFAPSSMSIESPIELYEERDANGETTPFAKQSEHDRRRVETSHSSSQAGQLPTTTPMERQAGEAFEMPTTVEPVSHEPPSLPQQPQRLQHHEYREHGEQGEQGVVEQEGTLQSVEVKVEGVVNQPTSYSHDIIEPSSLSMSTSLSVPYSQAEVIQTPQVDAFSEQQIAPLTDEHTTRMQGSQKDVLEEQELLVETQQSTVFMQQDSASSTSTFNDRQGSRENSGNAVNGEIVAEIEKSMPTTGESIRTNEGMQVAENRSQGLLLPQHTVGRGTVRVVAQQGDGEDRIVISAHELEPQEELLTAPQSSELPLQATILPTLLTSSMDQQERRERVEVARPSWEDVERELVAREEVVRVQREVLREEQTRIAEQVQQEQVGRSDAPTSPRIIADRVHVTQQEQARQSDSPSPRRIIPTQVHVTQQERALNTKEQTVPPVAPQVPPTIHVSIGRIEVRAVTPSTPAPRAKPARPSPSLSLEDYLKQQRGGR